MSNKFSVWYDRLLLLPCAYHYVFLLVIALLFVSFAGGLAKWQQQHELADIQIRKERLQKEIENYSQSSRLHKQYLERLHPISLAEAMRRADSAITASKGQLLRIEQPANEDAMFRVEAKLSSAGFYSWLSQSRASREVLLESLAIEQEGEELLLRATYRVFQ